MTVLERELTKSLPKDSIIHHWLQYVSIGETPRGFQIASGLSIIGALLWRSAGFNQGNWNVYLHMPVMFVGPSGVGKDTIINYSSNMLASVEEPEVAVQRIIQGKTMEFVNRCLAALGEPAAAVIKAPELTAFLGGKDYQKSMVQELTDLLSSNEVMNVSVASEQRVIRQPTVTMWAGTTAEWLQKAMPEGSMDGGFIPRFVVAYADRPARMVSLPYYSTDIKERARSKSGKLQFQEGLRAIMNKWPRDRFEYITPCLEAQGWYTNWYENRFSRFSPRSEAYANRARDAALKVSCLCAISCMRSIILPEDVQFAIKFMDYVADGIDKAVTVVPQEYKIAKEVLRVLPGTTKDVVVKLQEVYKKEDIMRAISGLYETHQIAKMGDKWVVRK